MRAVSWLSTRRVSYLFTIVAIILWSYSVCRLKFAIGLYGISGFPISFFIGLGFLTIASAILWLSPRNEGKLLLLQTCLFLIMLWLTPLLISPTMEIFRGGALGHLMFTDFVLQTGHLNPSVMEYHNWPGTSIVTAALVDIFGWHHADSLLPVIGITPLVASFFSLPLLYIFLKNMLGKGQNNYCWAGVWLFNVGYCLEILMFSPHGFGFFLLLAVFALLSVGSVWERSNTALGCRLVTILIFAALVITHLFSSLVVFITVIAFYITKKLKPLALVMLTAIFIASWTVYGAAPFFGRTLPNLVSLIFKVEELWTSGVSGRFAGSPAHTNVVLIRIVTLAIFLVIGITGMVLSRKVRWKSDKTALVMFVGVLIFTGGMGMAYGAELPMRLFLILLPFIAYFGVKLLNYRATAFVLCAVLLLVLPLHFITKYGNQYTEYRSPAYFSGVNFFFDHITEGYVIFDAGAEQLTEIRYTPYHRLSFANIVFGEESIYHLGITLSPAAYVAIANDKKYYDYVLGDPESFAKIEESLNSAKNCQLIYVSPDIQFYYLNPR